MGKYLAGYCATQEVANAFEALSGCKKKTKQNKNKNKKTLHRQQEKKNEERKEKEPLLVSH
jgi:hypothetical protein